MKIFSRMIQAAGKKHAHKLSTVVDRQTDPRLFDAIFNKIDKILGRCSSSPSGTINPEMEALEEALLGGMGLGELDNIIDLIKYGRHAINGAKYKLAQYAIDYRQALTNNLPKPRGRGWVLDLRKGNIPEQEVNNALKRMLS